MPVIRTLLALAMLLAFERGARADDVKQRCVAASTQGQALRDGEKLAEAREQFVACARDECPAIVRKYCAEWLADVERRLPTAVIRAQTAQGEDVTDARVTVDGKSVALDGAAIPLDPGEHAIHVEHAGDAPIDARVLIAEGDKGRVVAIHFPARPAPPPPPPTPRATPESKHALPLASAVAAVVGVAALGTSFLYYEAAKSDVDDMRTRCAPRCDSSDVDAAKSKALVSEVSFGVGVAAIGAAAYLYFARKSSEPAEPATALDVSPTRGGAVATVSARF